MQKQTASNKWNKAHPKKVKESYKGYKERRKKRIKAGLCARCGKKLSKDREIWTLCKICQAKERECRDKRKKRRHRQAFHYKGGKCLRCGVKDLPSCCYDFHHTDKSKKKITISRLMCNGSASWKRIKKELDKCILLCANCHRIVEHSEKDE